ncbi:phytase [bacterium]|nr:MAG: phytase [bacterium]
MNPALLLLAPLVSPSFSTTMVPHDADDPAVWIDRTNPAHSLIVGTDKEEKEGGVYVWNLEGRLVQKIEKVDRPNNVDVEYGFSTPMGARDLVVATERGTQRLRTFFMEGGQLRDVTGDTPMVTAGKAENGMPMGIGLWKRKDGVYAIVSPKSGPKDGYLQLYRLRYNAFSGRVDSEFVRFFGAYSGKKEIESVCVDDEAGFVYYSDEGFGTRKVRLSDYKEVGTLNRTGFKGDHEGLAIWKGRGGRGYLVCTEQLKGDSVYHVFRREGANAKVGSFRIGADETDGIEVVSTPLGPKFPQGLFIAMNSSGRNFKVAGWKQIASALRIGAQ